MPKVFDLPLHGFARSLLLGGGRISQRDLPFLILQLRDSGRLRAALLLQCFKRLPFSGSFCPCRHEIGSDLFKFVRALRNLSLQVIELSLQRVVRGCQMVGFGTDRVDIARGLSELLISLGNLLLELTGLTLQVGDVPGQGIARCLLIATRLPRLLQRGDALPQRVDLRARGVTLVNTRVEFVRAFSDLLLQVAGLALHVGDLTCQGIARRLLFCSTLPLLLQYCNPLS